MLQSVLIGCSNQQTVTERYPAWGDEVLLPRRDSKVPLHIRMLMPSEPAEALGCVLIVHGMNEYIGRYREIASYFGGRFIVAGVDLRGHGLSNPILFAGDRAIAGGATSYDVSHAYSAQAELRQLEPMRVDLDQALRYLIDRCDAFGPERKPVFIVSHSLGSLVSARYLMHPTGNDEPHRRIAGIIFVGPAFAVTQVPGWRGWFQNPFIDLSFHIHQHFLTPHDEPLPLLIMNQALALVLVPLLDGLVEILSLPIVRRVFTPTTPNWVVDYLTDSEPERNRHRADSYIIRRSILRYVLEVEKEIIRFRRSMANFDIPYLLIYAAHDPITPAWGNLDFAAATLDSHPDNRLLPLPDKHHHEQLFSAEPLNRQLLREIDQWLMRRLQTLTQRK